MQNDVFLRLVIIFFMILFIFALGGSAYFISGTSNQGMLFLHKSVGVIFLIILPMHIYLRKEKLKKMFLELYGFMFFQELDYSARNYKLIKTLKYRSLVELCNNFNFETESVVLFLKDQKIDVQNIEDNFQKISEQNASDALKIIAIVIEYHIRTQLERN